MQTFLGLMIGMANQRITYMASVDLAAVERQLLDWRADHPAMGVLVLLPEADKDQVPALQSLFRQHQVAVCGAIFPQLVFGDDFQRRGICLLRFDVMPYCRLYDNVPTDTLGGHQVARRIAADLTPLLGDEQPATLFMMLDGLLPHISTLLDELYLELANRVHYAGVNAGSESFQPMPCLFNQEQWVENGVLVMLLKPHQGAIVEHGYKVQERSLPATSTDGNRIIQIDWRPAFEVYQELVKAQFGVEIDRDNFYQYAVHFPFGIMRANHNVLVRIPVMLSDDHSLFCIGEIPPHAMLTLLAAPEVDSRWTLDTLRQGLCELSGDPAGHELLLFYCAGRRLHLGDVAASSELRRFAAFTGASTVVGGLALGEIGGSTLWGYPLFHNATLVTTVWGDDV